VSDDCHAGLTLSWVLQAFGAVAPSQKNASRKRVTVVIAATALAMAITAIILLSTQSSVSQQIYMFLRIFEFPMM
jgi:hypothetical protein